MPVSADDTLDATGLFCPEPVMLLHKKIRQVDAGNILLVLATDPSTQRDIAKFCGFLGHELLDHYVENDVYHYYIRKQQAAE
jgi:tRNA 2-thiouridine synthesizing protein A